MRLRPSIPRLIALLTALLLMPTLSGCSVAGPVAPGGPPGGSRPLPLDWCGMLELPDRTPDDAPLGGLSALAFDARRDRLYMLSDRGRLYHASPRFDHSGELTRLELLASFPLRGLDGQRLEMPMADSESLALLEGGDDQPILLIGFERRHRLQRFDTQGRALAAPFSPAALAGTSSNGGLEALTHHPKRGVIGGLEFAPTDMAEDESRLFDLDDHRWQWQRAAERSGLTDMAPLGDGLLMLERDFRPGRPLFITLSQARFEGDAVAQRVIARLASDEGWRLDNFEGLTHLGGGRYLMVSDDNFSLLQRSLLGCFELPAGISS